MPPTPQELAVIERARLACVELARVTTPLGPLAAYRHRAVAYMFAGGLARVLGKLQAEVGAGPPAPRKPKGGA